MLMNTTLVNSTSFNVTLTINRCDDQTASFPKNIKELVKNVTICDG